MTSNRTPLRVATTSLTGPFLTYCVALALGERVSMRGADVLGEDGQRRLYGYDACDSDALIERLRIRTSFDEDDGIWRAWLGKDVGPDDAPEDEEPPEHAVEGPTRLEAAMLALVRHKFGEEVDITGDGSADAQALDEQIRMGALGALKVAACEGLVINAPHWFRDEAFRDWLNNGEPKFTWHQGGQPTEWSEVVVLVDPGLGGEGTEAGTMPQGIWDAIVEQCRRVYRPGAAHHIMVRLTNVDG